MQLGILEIFFGPPWSEQDRLTWAPFCKQHGLDFFIYGPKADAFLRKRWRDEWPREYLNFLARNSKAFRENGIRFGVALSPFGLGTEVTPEDQRELKKKFTLLTDAGIDILGIFFDDMKLTDNLAEVQIDVMKMFGELTSAHLIFCPSYYTPDPILDKVFGQRPPDYLEKIGQGIAPNVDIIWTGPKVISEDIPAAHLRETSEVLGRKPFLCDNVFANDGPRHCKFLKLKPPRGRSAAAFQESSGWSLNMMNQSTLSKITGLATRYLAKDGLDPQASFEKALAALVSPALGKFISENEENFTVRGLDNLIEFRKTTMLTELDLILQSADSSFAGIETRSAAREIQAWLRGEFIVGSECLTD